MTEIALNFSFLKQIIFYVLVPLFCGVIISRIIVEIIIKKTKKHNESEYHIVLDYWATFVSIVVSFVLLVVMFVYGYYFITSMNNENLIDTHKVIYYVVLISPIIPFSFLIYCVIELFNIRHITKNNSKIDTEFQEEEHQFDLERLNKLRTESTNKNETDSIEKNQKEKLTTNENELNEELI